MTRRLAVVAGGVALMIAGCGDRGTSRPFDQVHAAGPHAEPRVQPDGGTSVPTSTSTTVLIPPLVVERTTAPGRKSPTTTARASRNKPAETTPAPAASSGRYALASWYDAHTRRAADGSALTFAHRTMAKGTRVRFCHDGRCVTATCTDRGPYIPGRTFDLSREAFAAIAPLGAGVATVTWEEA